MVIVSIDGAWIWADARGIRRLHTKREFFRQAMTSEGREVASWGWVVVADAS